MRTNVRVTRVVERHTTVYRAQYRPVVQNRYTEVSRTYYPRYHDAYRPWYHYGFRGGFYYPVTPVYEIQESFYNPIVFWLYADSYDETYYSTWYGSSFYQYRELQTPFQRPGVFFPTETLRELAFGVSALSIGQQIAFRAGIAGLADKLEWKLREGLFGASVYLGRNDIVVSHYEMLNDAIVLEGFVTTNARQFAFKALLDLNDSNRNLVFVPASYDGTITEQQLLDLRELNERIVYYGGFVETDDDVVTQPPVIVTEPPVVVTQPPVIVTEPPVIVTQPPVVITEPPVVVVTQPPVVITQPPVVVVRPQPPVVVVTPRRGRRGD
ncbi:MAG: hypothetical protein HY075_16610 [Deltaproteobacteria bacterium]|nr:hypothetical protein [Deltaproteobacteria bacterium]